MTNATHQLLCWTWLLLTLRLSASLPENPDPEDPGAHNSVHDSSPDFAESIQNVTVPVGREAVLSCSVNDLGNFKVGWLKAEDQTILTLHTKVVTHNGRISVSFDNANTWQLHIRQVKESDRGCYMCQINTSRMRKQFGCVDVHVPPDIVDTETSSDVTVREEQNATLVCRAKGHPMPRVNWRREDGQFLEIRSGVREIQKLDSYTGEVLHLNKVSRSHMGAYLCIASNDVPPAVSKRVILNVNFAPSIKIPNQLLGAPVGTDVLLECHVEASPNTINYWMKNRNEMLLHGDKHIIEENKHSYRVHLKLTVKNFSSVDVGTYMCVSTNSLGRADGTIRLYEIIVITSPPTTTTTTTEMTTTTKVAETTTAKPFKRVIIPYPVTSAPMESLREQTPVGRSSIRQTETDEKGLQTSGGAVVPLNSSLFLPAVVIALILSVVVCAIR